MGTANSPWRNLVVVKKAEPFENCTLIPAHTFKKNVLVEIRNFSERRAQISGVY